MRLNNAEPDSCVGLDLLLEIRCEVLERLGRNDGKRVDLKAPDAFAVLVDAQAQPRPIVCRRSRSVWISRRLQIWKTLGLSHPSRNAEWEKINLRGVSKLRSFSFSFMIRL